MGLFDFLKKKDMEVKTEENKKLDNIKEKTFQEIKRVIEDNVEISVECDGPLPLEDLIKDATPSKKGLYPHEIMMLEYATHFKTTNNNFQQFWYYQYSVTEPQKILESLYERGFIEIGDLKSAIEKLKLSEIKEELKILNQKVTGKKTELIERLLETAEIESLNEKYPERYYALTSIGKQELEENQYVSYLHRNRYMTIWEMNRRIAEKHYPYREILWGYFNEKSMEHWKNFNFGLYRNTRLDMYRFLMEEDKIIVAFSMLCEVLAIDLSGLHNSERYLFEHEQEDPEFYLSLYERRLKHFFPYEESSMTIAPGVVEFFKDMQNKMELNDNDYKEAVLNELKKVQLPRRIFTSDECADVLMACLKNDEYTLSAIYEGAEQREKVRLQAIRAKLDK